MSGGVVDSREEPLVSRRVIDPDRLARAQCFTSNSLRRIETQCLIGSERNFLPELVPLSIQEEEAGEFCIEQASGLARNQRQ